MSDTNGSRMAEYLGEHPRMMGALFTLLLLVTQAQPVLANNGGITDGP